MIAPYDWIRTHRVHGARHGLIERHDRRRIRVVDVGRADQVVAAAADVAGFSDHPARKPSRYADVPLHGARVLEIGGGRLRWSGRRWSLPSARSPDSASVAPVNVTLLTIGGMRERVLLEDADQRLVVIDAKRAAQHRVAVAGQVVGHADARLEAVLLELVDAVTVRRVDAALDDADQQVAAGAIDQRAGRIRERRRRTPRCRPTDRTSPAGCSGR